MHVLEFIRRSDCRKAVINGPPPISYAMFVTMLLLALSRTSLADFANGTPYPYTERYSLWAAERAFPVGAWHNGEGLLTPRLELNRYRGAGFTQYMGLSPNRHAVVFHQAESKGYDWQADHKDWADLATFQEQTDIAMAIGNGPTAMHIYDEPGGSSIPTIVERLNWARSTYQENPANTGRAEPLLYANLSIRKIDVDTYVQQVEPDLISWTEYPLFRDGSTDRDYFARMHLARSASLRHNLPMWNFQQAYGRHTAENNILYRLPSRTDMRFQAFSFIGHGGLGIKYFIYLATEFPETIIDSFSGTPTEVYYHIQDLVPELKNLGRALPALRPVGDVGFLGNALTKYDGVKEFAGRGSLRAVDVTRPAQVSFFEDVSGDEYFMVTNLAHRADNEFIGDDTIRLRFAPNIIQVEKLSRFTGQIELLNTQANANATERYLDVTLLGGNGDLFKYKTVGDFALINSAPSAVAGGPYIYSALSTSVLLDGSGSSDPDQDITRFRWLLQDDTSKVGETVLLPIAESGLTGPDNIGEVTLRVNDTAGNSTDTDQILYLNDKPSAGVVHQEFLPDGVGYQFTVELLDADLEINTLITDFEALAWEIDTESATLPAQIGDGILTGTALALSDNTDLTNLRAYFGSAGIHEAYLNVHDKAGATDFQRVEIIAAITGDANFDGIVDVADLGILGANFNATDMQWNTGDFNLDNMTDVADLGILGANWTASQTTGNTASLVPEPTTLSLLAMSVLVVGQRRR